MNDSNSNAETFDVFLCHNTDDKSEIRKIADDLSRRGLKPWLDEREMQPGKPWQAILENQIETIEAAAVFVGKSGLGPWQNMEMRAFISEFVERGCPVIPVILPSAAVTPKLPILLKSLHWVDFRNIDSDPLKHLIWGITGKKPDHQKTNDSSSIDLQIPREANGQDLLPTKATQTIELRLPGNVEEFSPEQQLTLMQSLSALLRIGEVKVTKVVAGSTRTQTRRCGQTVFREQGGTAQWIVYLRRAAVPHNCHTSLPGTTSATSDSFGSRAGVLGGWGA